MVKPSLSGYHFRKLSPDQAAAVLRAYEDHVLVPDLAKAYGVSIRTIWRTIRRAPERPERLSLFGYSAGFVRGDDGPPVQIEPWRPE
jgi:transposase-like protein